jgi:hypothetical protein
MMKRPSKGSLKTTQAENTTEAFEMGIFTGNEILFFFTGVLVVGLAVLIVMMNKKRPFKWPTWVTSITGGGMLIFAMNWAISSILEGEAQAANVGLMVFGIPALILIGVTVKMNTAQKQSK